MVVNRIATSTQAVPSERETVDAVSLYLPILTIAHREMYKKAKNVYFIPQKTPVF